MSRGRLDRSARGVRDARTPPHRLGAGGSAGDVASAAQGCTARPELATGPGPEAEAPDPHHGLSTVGDSHGSGRPERPAHEAHALAPAPRQQLSLLAEVGLGDAWDDNEIAH